MNNEHEHVYQIIIRGPIRRATGTYAVCLLCEDRVYVRVADRAEALRNLTGEEPEEDEELEDEEEDRS